MNSVLFGGASYLLLGTNDAFVTIALEKNKFQTTIKDSVIDPEWYEECDL